MTGFAAIAGVGKSIERMLTMAFTDREPVENKQTRALLIKTDDLMRTRVDAAVPRPALSIFLYRVDFNKAMRAAWSAIGTEDGRGHLALDLHFLLTPWADNAEYEHLIIGRAMQAIEYTPILSGPLYYAPTLPPADADEPRPSATEAIQLVLEEISTEALMRIFDSLPTDYRLSVPYIARVVRLDTRDARARPPVSDAQFPLRIAT